MHNNNFVQNNEIERPLTHFLHSPQRMSFFYCLRTIIVSSKVVNCAFSGVLIMDRGLDRPSCLTPLCECGVNTYTCKGKPMNKTTYYKSE